ncbi:MAG: hypothetical protein H0V17_12145 [Deltaproteobacteria bacterium]|nr:hypothetical protein [Deltaproteobacteria bacterium]
MKLAASAVITIAIGACGGDEPGVPLAPPIAQIPATLSRLAINDTSMFSIDLDAGELIELGLDGSSIGTLPTAGEVTELAAHGDLVAWVEIEGTGTVIKRRRGANPIESHRTFDAHLIANADGLFFSDLGLIAAWPEGVPQRIATPIDTTASPRLLDVDSSFAYVAQDAGAVIKYTRDSDISEVQLETSEAATVKAGQLAYRAPDGIRMRDLFSGFDRVVGFVPASYACELLIVEQAVMCNRFRVLQGNAAELLVDPVVGYAAVGREVYWITSADGISEIRVTDAESIAEGE